MTKQFPLENPGLSWRVITVKEPIIWPQTQNETWLLNPPNRYVVTSDAQAEVDDKLVGWSDLKSSAHYVPLQASMPLAGKNILVERDRRRGIGDLLFLTGPLAYLYQLNSYNVNIYLYTALNRSKVLHGVPFLANEMPMSGPLIYDTFPRYAAHWFIESVTEYDQEPDQLNVYDCLFQQLGVDYTKVDADFKRPWVTTLEADLRRADDFKGLIYMERNVNLREKRPWIVAPVAHSVLRMASYKMWLDLIKELSKQAPVIVVGQVANNLMPAAELGFGDFYQQIAEMARTDANVINLMGDTPMRLIIGLLDTARGLITPDSGLLYVAQGLRLPAISLWGPQHPGTRIGYDQPYMDLAIWHKEVCPYSPCFQFNKFPEGCPGKPQNMCLPLLDTSVTDVMDKVELLNRSKLPNLALGPFSSGKPAST